MYEGPASPRCEKRILAFDAVRAWAMLLGVLFHGSVAYMVRPLPELLWPVRDQAAVPFFDLLFWWIHSFRMPLFFVVAGYFAEATAARSGPAALLASRGRRLLVPFAGACLVVLPAVFGVWALGWWQQGRAGLSEIRRLRFLDPVLQGGFLGPAHLWFLEDLFVLVLCFAALRPWLVRWRAAAGLLPLAGAILLALDPAVFTAFRNGFVPDPSRLAWNGTFFVAGALLRAFPEALLPLARWSPLLLALSAVVAGTAVLLGSPGVVTPSGPSARALYATAVVLLAWLTALGLLGLSLRVPWPPEGRWRGLADTAYWVYLTHLPVVGAMQILVAPWRVPAALKLAVVVAATAFLTVASGRRLVRWGPLAPWIGRAAPARGRA